ncbi:gp53-like domain-containing protein, partial [Citrobacter freundii]
QIVITQPTFNAVMDVIGYDGITRHVDIWFSSTPDEYFSRYQVMIAGYQGSRTFSVRRIWTSSEPVPLSGGGTGASTPAGARSNLELGGLSVEDIAPINKGGTGADNVSSALNNFGIGPIANASEVTAGTSKKLIDAVLLKAFLPKRSFQANDVIRIPDQPGGLMVQFGTLTGVSGSDVISSTLTFPELFPNACLAVIPVAVSSDTGGGMVGVQVKTLTRSNADIFIYERNGGAIAAHSVQYIAIGW